MKRPSALAPNDADQAWANLGRWRDGASYSQACHALALALGEAAQLQPGHQLLDLGFGYGAQLQIWRAHFAVNAVTGLNPDVAQVRFARSQVPDCRLIAAPADRISAECPNMEFDRVLALDSAYHFRRRNAVWQQAWQVLRPGGRLAVTDLTLGRGAPPGRSAGLRAIGGVCGIPRENFLPPAHYQAALEAAGFAEVTLRDLTAEVFQPFAIWWRRVRKQPEIRRMPRRIWLRFELTAAGLDRAGRGDWLRYQLITADKPTA